MTLTPDEGYELDKLIVRDKNGNTIKLTEKDENKFTFKMPGSRVEVEASFILIGTKPEIGFARCSSRCLLCRGGSVGCV